MLRILPFLFALFFLLFFACKKEEELKKEDEIIDEPVKIQAQDTVKINEIQILASHNSYRLRTYEPIFNQLVQFSFLPSDLDPNDWDYTHPSFDIQFGHNVRSLEIDIFNDPNGGHFYDRHGLTLVNEPVESGIAELNTPGYKVLHVPDLDYRTHYHTFIQALEALKSWSDQNPNHVPIFIYVEGKSEAVGDVVSLSGYKKAIPYDAAAADALDNEVKTVFGAGLEKVITPDDIRGDFSSLNEAALAKNWPILKEARGKFMFIISGSELINHYVSGHPNLEGRSMFVFGDPGETYTACLLRNSPQGNESTIAGFVNDGYIVRTRADNGIESAKGNDDYSKSTAAFASGAQIVSTDYYRPDPRSDTSSVWTDFQVQLPNNGIARFNPVNASGLLESEEEITE
ncbi:MAG: Ca2+-dependent phosphoinositide-specific phospholipase C [Chitinophagales bacterium]